MPATNPTHVFFSYAPEDEQLRIELEKHLSLLKRDGIINGWSDRRVSPGANLRDEIDRNLDAADIILLLISADFLASDYCYGVEMARAIERHTRSEAQVIPVILRPCDWTTAPFGTFKALPENKEPVTSWPNVDEAMTSLAKGIREAVTKKRQAVNPSVAHSLSAPSR